MAEKKEKEVRQCSAWALGMARAYPKELLKRSKIWEYVRCAFPEEVEEEKKEEVAKSSAE